MTKNSYAPYLLTHVVFAVFAAFDFPALASLLRAVFLFMITGEELLCFGLWLE